MNATLSLNGTEEARVLAFGRSQAEYYITVGHAGDSISLFVGGYNAECVQVARALAAKLIAAADELESKLSAPAPPSAPAPAPAEGVL